MHRFAPPPVQYFYANGHKTARFVFALILVFFLFSCTQDSNHPLVERGHLDLSGWNFNQNGTVQLDGQWTVYRQQLLSPAKLSGLHSPKPDGTIAIPGFWTGQDAIDYATCRLRLRLNPGHSGLVLRIGDVNSAYRLWVNGNLATTVGMVGSSRQEEIPKNDVRIIHINTIVDDIDLVLQISNFHNYSIGVADPIRLGREADIREQDRKTLGYALIICGFLLVMGVYHVLLYFIRPSDRSTLYFGLLSLEMGIWHLASNSSERFLLDILPILSQQAFERIDLLAYYLSIPTGLMFLQTNFPRECNRLVLRLFQTLAVIFSLVVLLTPNYIFVHTVRPYMFITLLFIVYAFVIVIKATYHKREGSTWIFAGYAVLMITAVNDILYANRLLQTVFIIPVGMLSLMFSHSFVLALKFFKAFSTVDAMSRELAEKNIALSRLDQIKDKFLANTSHELRTPLTGIIGLTESLISGVAGKLPQKALANLTMVTASARRLSNLINDILDTSKLKNSDIRIQQAAVDIRSVAHTVLTISEQLLQGRPLRLINRIPTDIGCVTGDEDRIQQILFNLIGNAVKFTDQGEVVVSAAKNQGMVEIAVSDTGSGIPANKHATIFESFEQADASETRSHGGTGLGLTITRQLVELHGGTIGVDSIPGEGATFRFTLPICTESASSQLVPSLPVAAIAIPQPSHQPDFHAEAFPDESRRGRAEARVLVVDDDPINLQVVSDHLFLAGITVQTAADGTQALACLEDKSPPDMILLDLMMPGMSGYEVCTRVRRFHSVNSLPVILLTARNQVTELVRGFAAGANDYLTKPFTGDELIARVNTHLKVKQAYATLKENLRLKNEIKLREQTEQELRLTQRRLAGVLNSVEDAILTVNESAEICFCNRIFENWLGHSADQLLGKPVEHFLIHDAMQQLQPWLDRMAQGDDAFSNPEAPMELGVLKKDGRTLHCQALPVMLQLDEERLLVLIMPTEKGLLSKATAPFGNTRQVINTLNRNRERLHSLKNALNGLPPQILAHKPDFLEDLHSLDSAMAQIGHDLLYTSPPDKRSLSVDLMNLSVQYWCLATQSTKSDFAAASGLWSVYINHNGNERTQTLDRYLDINTLPKRPQWQKIVRSAEFVLESAYLPQSQKDQLEAMLAKLCLTDC